ncbi:BTAD domain-containing putative transcriptional regulator [Candidatus Chloroploca sp. Khr17]|uniref:AfsR/SARP family transcriptional regulator n=1 Tax=Candidatus Chloroploca sp. Khr17 TaxID=2496869 RepID=UPI00101CA7AA|nr:BTAD domain-containing putative transcriptional regulator [Candidatus Chloroploca sp. Khr17]
MLFLLGAMQLVVDGRKVALFIPEKSLALLGYLAAHRGMHSRRTLAGLFWGDMAEERAQANLRMALYSLQKTLPAGYIQADRKSVAFDPEGLVELDSEQFEQMLDAVCDLAKPTSLDTLDHAIRLYRGEFMAGIAIEHEFEFAEWLYERRTWYHGRVLGALDDLITAATRHSAWPRAITATRKLLALDPCREQAHRQLMHLLAQQGAYTAALEQYATCQTILHARMGLTPMPETDALYARISLARLRGPPPLPDSTLPLVGHEQELGLLYQYLVIAPLRLVTLLGPGGVGKTRIALATAAHQYYAWRNGICFVPLANLTSGTDLAQAIAEVLQLALSGQRSPHEDLLNFLTNREMLLILDHFEHVRDESLALVEAILATAPGVQLLVTSRERLSLSNEVCLKVEGRS